MTRGRGWGEGPGSGETGIDELTELRATLEAISSTRLFATYAPDGTFLAVNDGFLSAYGYARADLIGRHHRLIAGPGALPVQDSSDLWATLARGSSVAGQFRRAGRDGRVVLVHSEFNPVLRPDGTVFKIIELAIPVNTDLPATQVVHRAQAAAAAIMVGAGELSQTHGNLSQRTQQLASTLEQTASSMEQMLASIRQSVEHADQADLMVAAARQQAAQGGEVVGGAVRAMSEISAASRKIADIIGVIDEIAFQTNLLALNAAVEAARAGEQGRGFAVVATEVRNLAGRSSMAAKQIKDLIRDSVRKVEDGTALVERSGGTLEQIVGSVQSMSGIVAGIATAAREQLRGIERVNQAVIEMDSMTRQNAALVETATAAQRTMSGQAQELSELVGRPPSGRSDTDASGDA